MHRRPTAIIEIVFFCHKGGNRNDLNAADLALCHIQFIGEFIAAGICFHIVGGAGSHFIMQLKVQLSTVVITLCQILLIRIQKGHIGIRIALMCRIEAVYTALLRRKSVQRFRLYGHTGAQCQNAFRRCRLHLRCFYHGRIPGRYALNFGCALGKRAHGQLRKQHCCHQRKRQHPFHVRLLLEHHKKPLLRTEL